MGFKNTSSPLHWKVLLLRFPTICESPKIDSWFKHYGLLKFKYLKPYVGKNIGISEIGGLAYWHIRD